MEEKLLLPAAQRLNGGAPLAVAAKLRLDHGVLAVLFVPLPTAVIGRTIRTILAAHNPLEEGRGGLHETCETLARSDIDGLVAQLRTVPHVKLAPNLDSPSAIESARRALTRAGYVLPE